MADQNVNITIRALDKTKKGFASVTGGLKRVAGSVLNMKTAIVGAVGAGGFGALIQSSINAGDELAKTADKLGVTTQALAGLRHAAELTGVSTGTMDMALQRFTRRAAEAANGTGEAKGALRELGIDAESIVRLPLDEQMNIVAEAMSGVETQSDRVRLAMKLFDSEGVALVNTLGGGADALKAMTEEAEHLGLTLSRTDTAQMEAANDAITRLQAVFTGLTNQLAVAFAPIITFVADAFRQAALDTSEFGRIGQMVASGVVKAFGVVRNMIHGVQIVFKTAELSVLQLAAAFGQKLTPVLDFFIKKYNDMAESMVGGLIGMEAITTTGEQLVGALPAAIAETELALESLKKSNPGSDLVVSMEAFIVANRRAAESIAEVTEAATGAGGLDVSAPNFVDRLNDSFTKLHENLPTVQEQMDKMAKTTMKNMSDSLMGVVKGTVKLKDAFKQMAASLIMQAIQLFVIDKITGGFLSFAKGLTGKAIGGSVQSGQPYMVGERGPEMFVPNQSGSIIPNKKMGGGVTVINNVDARGSGADVDQKIKFAMAQSSQQTIMTIQDLMRRRRFV
jgi:hypothetical protein